MEVDCIDFDLPLQFNADHPFMFSITKNTEILFVGTYRTKIKILKGVNLNIST